MLLRLDFSNISSSPRPWGCFHELGKWSDPVIVVPTPVGVFLAVQVIRHIFGSRPHARGGVSVLQASLR